MVNKKQTAIFATLIMVVAATIASGAMYVMANQPIDQLNQDEAFEDSTPGNMPGLETRPDNQTDSGPDGPQL